MSAPLEVDQLRVGMFIHLDLGWWAHPFALSSFAITSPDQIETIRGLGLKKLRWSPDKSLPAAAASAAPAPAAAAGNVVESAESAGSAESAESAAPAAPAEPAEPLAAAVRIDDPAAQRRAAIDAQRAADRRCAQQYGEAASAWNAVADQVRSDPQGARVATEGLTHSLLSKMMVDDEMCVRVLSLAPGDQDSAHALNVAVMSLLLGRVFGLTASEMLELGTGALLHDIGKLDLPDRVRHLAAQCSGADKALYGEHVAHGVVQGKRMGLSSGALLVLAQHHEMADGSGFPLRLKIDRMAAAARIVSLVNRYDNLCNPKALAQALTPHEALSLIFAQTRAKFDASMLNAFIRMMGVYPPGSFVQLTDDRFASVLSVNSSRPLKPRVLVCDPEVPMAQALPLNLEREANLGVRRSLKPAQLPAEVHRCLAPRQRVVYFFEPAHATALQAEAVSAA